MEDAVRLSAAIMSTQSEAMAANTTIIPLYNPSLLAG